MSPDEMRKEADRLWANGDKAGSDAMHARAAEREKAGLVKAGVIANIHDRMTAEEAEHLLREWLHAENRGFVSRHQKMQNLIRLMRGQKE